MYQYTHTTKCSYGTDTTLKNIYCVRAASKPFSSTPKLAIIADKELMIYESLKKGEENFSYKVYIKEEFPEEFHYAANDKVQELIVVANEVLVFSYPKLVIFKCLLIISQRVMRLLTIREKNYII